MAVAGSLGGGMAAHSGPTHTAARRPLPPPPESARPALRVLLWQEREKTSWGAHAPTNAPAKKPAAARVILKSELLV